MPHSYGAGAPVPSAHDLGWLALIPTTAPALSDDERARVTSILGRSVDPRVSARCTELLAA